ncbi:NAD(P)/FAD-dependent oxidoreductase [Zavarzinia compransoris]|uniref:NAD(P)/FAD-dependent oxidoreductase n=1 Tax=Zavarzinia marina TaxID=2911065 RepID=UPI001F2E323B|nr:NAD(P)/FAD-dependent oxidoreductase [Zavarzinia marina]MCF4167653.1 NAD(P)/FAD-dependent oxidoreductase [Zavarzinia marina]
MSDILTTDIAVIGAGPVGLFTVFEAGMLGMKSVVIDALDGIGGQCSALYPEKPIYDIPAHPSIDGQTLVEQLEAQAAPFAPYYLLEQQVTHLEPQSGGRFLLRTSTGARVDAGAVIIAAGCGAFGPNRPPLDGLPAYEATKGVQYMVRRREDFRGKRVVIAGGGDSAVDWALSLPEVAASVSLVHRRPKFRAAPESLRQLDEMAKAGKVDLVVPYQLDGLEGADGTLSGVVVSTLDGQKKVLPADVLLPFYGLAMTLGPIADWGLGLEDSRIGIDQATGATNVPGIFAAGDIAVYPHKLKLILSGFAEAASACHSAHAHIHPDKVVHFEYSTTKGVPGAA